MNKFKSIAIWVVISLLAAAFVAAGGAKLAGVEMVHMSFANMGLPAWFGYFIGASEVAGAIVLFNKKWSALAASGLAIIMFGAIGYHLSFDPLSAAVPALVLAVLSVVVFVNRRQHSLLAAIR